MSNDGTHTHNPCCSSHGVDMSCERYRRTHFVEVRPCCTDDQTILIGPLTSSEWRDFQSIPDQGFSHRAWIDAKIAQRVAAELAEYLDGPRTEPTDPHDATERDADYGGIMCAECGWKLGGRDAHPDADAQHRAHTQPTDQDHGNGSK